MDLAIWESQKIWAGSTAPDIVLSLGTGTEDQNQSPKAPHFRHIINDGFIPRLARSFMSSTNGEQTYRDSVNRMDDRQKANCFRLNVELPGEEPRLDDVGQIDALRNSVCLRPGDVKDLRKILGALLAASFFFELDISHWFEQSLHECRGFIRCRNDPREIIRLLNELYPGEVRFATPTGSTSTIKLEDICSACNSYCKRVHFQAGQPTCDITICLRFNDLEHRNISGFPQTIDRLVDREGLNSPFGNWDHDKLHRQRCPACSSFESQRGQRPTARKRKRESAQVLSRRSKKPHLSLSRE